MLVYDITNEKSFDNIRNWIRNIEEVRLAGPIYTQECPTCPLLGPHPGVPWFMDEITEAQRHLQGICPEPHS